MHLVQEFETYAEQCQDIARATREPEARSMWNRMAERWLRLAKAREAAEAQVRAAQEPRRVRQSRYRAIYGQE